jgi:hypothetical protein
MSDTTVPVQPPAIPTKRQRYRLDPSRTRDYPLKHIPQALAILEACDQRALLTNGQLSRLFFVGRPNAHGDLRELAAAEKAAAKVLHRLWEGGWLERRQVMLTSRRTGGAYHHYVNVLSASGAQVLEAHYAERGRGELRWKRPGVEVSNQTIEHTLAINDFYVLASRAAELRDDVAFFSWKDDRQLAAMTRATQLHLVSIPDAFFVLGKDRQPFGCFLEIDLGSEAVGGERSTRIWREKIAGYGRYLRERYQDEAFFEGVPAPIVLTVTTSPTRLANMLSATREMAGADRFWYTTIDALTPERIVSHAGKQVAVFRPETLWQSIWRVASDPAPRSLADYLGRETPR